MISADLASFFFYEDDIDNKKYITYNLILMINVQQGVNIYRYIYIRNANFKCVR